jgi:RHS repeat-associated protein
MPTTGTATTTCTVAPSGDLPARLGATSGTTSTWYVQAFDQELLREQGSATTAFVTDRLGSLRGEYSVTGALTAQENYDPFGASEGTPLADFGYAGAPHESPWNLIDLQARWDSPTIGRFLIRDPVTGQLAQPLTLDPYADAQDNPLNLTDPSGRRPGSVCDGPPPENSPPGDTPPGGAPPPHAGLPGCSPPPPRAVLAGPPRPFVEPIGGDVQWDHAVVGRALPRSAVLLGVVIAAPTLGGLAPTVTARASQPG